MVDVVTSRKRSEMMSGIRGKDTKPEIIIRKGLHKKGFRYILHNNKLPGKPDLVLPKFNAVIFVNGCFWHLHGCHLFKWPKTRSKFWKKKITRNREKDIENIDLLMIDKWRVLLIWECAIKGKNRLDIDKLLIKTITWIKSKSKYSEIIGKL